MKPKAILDIKGLLMHSLHTPGDKDAILLEDGKRTPTATYGLSIFLERYLLPLLKDFAPIDIIACWDGGRRYRKGLYPGYKAKRDQGKEGQDPVIKEQLEKIENMAKALLAHMGAINVVVNHVEADDLIARVCQSLDSQGVHKVVQTVDADLLALSNDLTAVSVREEFIEGDYAIDKGCDPIPTRLITLYKSIAGDSSDEYPGVKGVGPAGWQKLVDAYGFDGMEEIEQCIKSNDFSMIAECIEADGNQTLKKIYDDKVNWKLMYNLAQLHPELCYGMTKRGKVEPKFYTRVPDAGRVKAMFDQIGEGHSFEQIEHYFGGQTLVTMDNLDDVFEMLDDHLPDTPFVAFDYESYDTLNHPDFNEAASAQTNARGGYVDVLSQLATGGAFTFGENLQHTVYFSVRHKDTKNVPPGTIADVLSEITENLGKELVVHNAAFEEQLSKQCFGYQLKEPTDTMIMSSYVNEEDSAGLKMLSKQHLNFDQTSYGSLMEACGAENMADLTGDQVLEYGCDDALVTAHLKKLFELICILEGTYDFYMENERSTVHLLNQAFSTGVRIDLKRLEELKEKDAKTVKEGMDFIRSELEKHCTKENMEVAKAYIEADREYLEAELKIKKEKNRSQIASELERLTLLASEACVYTPFQIVNKDVEFVPTPKGIWNICCMLGLTPPDYELKSVAASRITEFFTVLEEWGWRDNVPRETKADAGEFIALLRELINSKQLKGREGDCYEAFHSFCSELLEGTGKEETIGDELNLGSPKQMKELLYLKLGLPVRERTKKQKGSFRHEHALPGSPATDEKAIEIAIINDCDGENSWKADIVRAVLNVKSAMTRESLYWNPYPKWIHPKDGCIHPQIRNCGTVTRRPTGSNPNVLQVSKGDVRSIFLPRYDNHLIVCLDFSGQELRITGSESKDPTFIDAYTGGGTWTDDYGMVHPVIKDVHSVTACSFAPTMLKRRLTEEVIGALNLHPHEPFNYDTFTAIRKGKDPIGLGDKVVMVQKVLEDCRKMAKAVNFLIIYGGGPFTLAKNLGIDTDFAESIMRMVFSSYARLEPWQHETIEFAYNNGYVKTAYGTLKHIGRDIRSSDRGLKSRAERQAVNQTIQGCAADILKVVLHKAYDTNLFKDVGGVMLAPVYDEIAASVPASNLFEYIERLQDIMNLTPPGHAIPMMAEVTIGKNWCDQIELFDRPAQAVVEKAIEEVFS